MAPATPKHATAAADLGVMGEVLGTGLRPNPWCWVVAGVGRIPEDRHGAGLVGRLPLWENAIAERYRTRFAEGPWIRRRSAQRYARDIVSRFDVRAGGGIDTAAQSLSGGNMQKLILGREMALFHQASAKAAPALPSTWQSLGSDLALLYDRMQNPVTRAADGMSVEHAQLVRRHCDLFFSNAERLGYHQFPKLPVLIDWNRGNFSVAYEERGFRLFSRWDYDWFRIEPRALDFYFFSRVVREEGDQTVFSYHGSPLLEPRFLRFVRSYHAVYPLSDNELAFTKEAYRFFLLNYVIRTGEHFFVEDICGRLAREALGRYLPELESLDFSPLLECLHSSG
jgi:hypothetical protein